ncbi:hypothetical protein [uncultured Parolsenella sp.]|uniref:PTS sugar transporter subunit IIA n=1 Tax=uncultured Parolsenella sp. TaxID=2083008 RepID=UPI0027D9B46D|nr:hypothetical protein [uncultured Parolsenella sp.]
MRHVILASHHRFAVGLADTLEFLGAKNQFDVVCAYVDERPLPPQVAALFSKFGPDDEVLVLTDIMQGSVNQAFVPYAGPHVFVVAGVNVALAFELCLKPEPLTCEDINQAIEAAHSAMCLINTVRVADGEDDE